MFKHDSQRFSIYFGDESQSVSLDEINSRQETQSLINIKQQLNITPSCTKVPADRQIALLKQEHGVQGMQIQLDDDQSYIFNPVGDYLFTQRKNCGIGVVTADCLPIVIYDPVTHAAGIVHAGWKGLAAEIFELAIQDMVEKLGVKSENIEIYLGPAARPCCYEVQQDFIDKFKKYENDSTIFRRSAEVLTQDGLKKDDKIYFDSRAFITVIARSLGMMPEKIYTRYNVCTICNKSFCSYRRNKDKARRQITMICLH